MGSSQSKSKTTGKTTGEQLGFKAIAIATARHLSDFKKGSKNGEGAFTPRCEATPPPAYESSIVAPGKLGEKSSTVKKAENQPEVPKWIYKSVFSPGGSIQITSKEGEKFTVDGGKVRASSRILAERLTCKLSDPEPKVELIFQDQMETSDVILKYIDILKGEILPIKSAKPVYVDTILNYTIVKLIQFLNKYEMKTEIKFLQLNVHNWFYTYLEDKGHVIQYRISTLAFFIYSALLDDDLFCKEIMRRSYYEVYPYGQHTGMTIWNIV
ncbi:uncharacterized protein IL334_007709 [Kwoniella shivajii]|uniref:BTB domain-containing protein n=1 Tax=Kwoniella shivajii TaxID=564305 RepID=A0ABZ1DA77_9TREE|nr:hypothetical protein IL334_007709 [Kwoniella shivajii]